MLKSKVFCIGFNKTATTSLDKLFQLWGMSSFHGEYHELSFDDRLFDKYQCFSDGESHDFKGLDQSFQDSKFILNTRKMDDWLVSRIKHVEYRLSNHLETGWMAKEYTNNPKLALQSWISRRVAYYQNALDYFSAREGTLLIVNVCDCQNQRELITSIASFLGVDDFGVLKLPRENLADQRIKGSGPGLKRQLRSFFSKKYKVRDEKLVRREVKEALEISQLPPSEWHSDGFNVSS